MDVPWANAPPVERECLCSNRSLPITVKSTSNVVEVHFTIKSMDALDDYNKLFFEGAWEFVKTVPCANKRRMRGPAGQVKYDGTILDDEEVCLPFLLPLYFEDSDNIHELQKRCQTLPWLIDPGPGQYLYVKVNGELMSNSTKCDTKNRVVVHAGGKIRASVCPREGDSSYGSSGSYAEVFSDGWPIGPNTLIVPPDQETARSVAVEFIIQENIEGATYALSWLELRRRSLDFLEFMCEPTCSYSRLLEISQVLLQETFYDIVSYAITAGDTLWHCVL